MIGGGFVGAAAALRLQAVGVQTLLIDPGDKRRAASFGNIGQIAAEQVSPWASRANLRRFPSQLFAFGGPLDFRWRDAGLWLPWSLRFVAASDPLGFARGEQALTALMREALPAWTRIAALADSTHIVRPTGHAAVWMNPRKAETGLNAWRRAPLGATRFRDMQRDELDAYAGTLRTPPHAGILFSGTAQMCEPQAARDALLSAFTARGGEIITDEVRLISRTGGISVALGSGARRSADAVLVAAGAWSSALMRQLGAKAPLIGERGYSIHSAGHAWPTELPPTVFEERSLVVSRFDSGLRASSFLEFGRPDAPGDPRKWRALQRHLAALGIAFSEAPDIWVGPRPTLPDYLPAIGRLSSAPNVFYAFGHQHLGVTNAAITAEIIEALATDNPPPLDLAPFRIERFK